MASEAHAPAAEVDDEDEHERQSDGEDELARGRRHSPVLPRSPAPSTLRDSVKARDVAVGAELMQSLYLCSNESMLAVSELHGKGAPLSVTRFIPKATGAGRPSQCAAWSSPVRNEIAIALVEFPLVGNAICWESFDAAAMRTVFRTTRATARGGSAADSYLDFGDTGLAGHFGAPLFADAEDRDVASRTTARYNPKNKSEFGALVDKIVKKAFELRANCKKRELTATIKAWLSPDDGNFVFTTIYKPTATALDHFEVDVSALLEEVLKKYPLALNARAQLGQSFDRHAYARLCEVMASPAGAAARERLTGGALTREEMESDLDVWASIAQVFNDSSETFKRSAPLTIYDAPGAALDGLPDIDVAFRFTASVQGCQTAWGSLRTALSGAYEYARVAMRVRARACCARSDPPCECAPTHIRPLPML